MPGVFRYSVDEAAKAAARASLGIPAIALFPTPIRTCATRWVPEALNDQNLVCQACRAIKDAAPDLGIITDVALDPYTSHGHDGVMEGEEILNDETVHILVEQALNQGAPARTIAPSDMMDGASARCAKA